MTLRCLLTALALLGLLAGSRSAAAREPRTVLVYQFRALGVGEDTALRISQLLAKEIDRLPGFRSLDPSDFTAMIKAEPALASCSADVDCLLRAGRSSGAELVLSGVLARMGDSYSMDVRLLAVSEGRERRRLVQTWDGEEARLIEVMRQLATRALVPEAFVGRLRIQLNQPGVKVYVDGDFVGRSPLPVQELAPGKHAVKLVAEGFEDVQRFVEVAFGRERLLDLSLVGTDHRETVAAIQVDAGWAAGLRLGLVSDFGDLLGPSVMLDAQWRMPFWGRRLALELQSGVFLSRRSGRTELVVSEELEAETEFLAWPSLLGLLLRPWPQATLSPWLSFGAGPCLYWQRQQLEGYREQTLRRVGYVLQAQLGAELHLGPGTLNLMAGYRHAPLPEEDGGGWQGRLGGLVLEMGYWWWW